MKNKSSLLCLSKSLVIAEWPASLELLGCMSAYHMGFALRWNCGPAHLSPVPTAWTTAISQCCPPHQTGSRDSSADRIPGEDQNQMTTGFSFWKTWMMMLSLRCSAERTDLFIFREVGFFSDDFQKKLDFCSFLSRTFTIFPLMQMWYPNLSLIYVSNKSLDLVLMKANSCSR